MGKLTENETKMEILWSSLHAALHFPLPLYLCLCVENAFNLWPGPGSRTRTWRLLSAKCVCPKNCRSPTPKPSRSIYFLQLAPMQMHWLQSRDGGNSRQGAVTFFDVSVNKINSFSWRTTFSQTFRIYITRNTLQLQGFFQYFKTIPYHIREDV